MANKLATFKYFKDLRNNEPLTVDFNQNYCDDNKILTRNDIEVITGISFNDIHIDGYVNMKSNKCITEYDIEKLSLSAQYAKEFGSGIYDHNCYIVSNNNKFYSYWGWRRMHNAYVGCGGTLTLQNFSQQYAKCMCVCSKASNYVIFVDPNIQYAQQFAKATGSSFNVNVDVSSDVILDHASEVKGHENTVEYYKNSGVSNTAVRNAIAMKGGLYNHEGFIPTMGEWTMFMGQRPTTSGVTNFLYLKDPFGQSPNSMDDTENIPYQIMAETFGTFDAADLQAGSSYKFYTSSVNSGNHGKCIIFTPGYSAHSQYDWGDIDYVATPTSASYFVFYPISTLL